jgi:outer membrane protein assembly factor BamB
MNKIFFILLITATSIISQHVKVALISDVSINDKLSSVKLDSMIAELNRTDINLAIITGNLTSQGTTTQFELLKQSFDKLLKTYMLLPFENDCREFSGWNKFYEYWNDGKFFFDDGKNIFLGISPTLHYSHINFYSSGKIDWLKTTLEEIGLGREIYFISPTEIEKINGWQNVIDLLSKSNVKLIANGNAQKFQQRNLFGIPVIDFPTSFPKPIALQNKIDKANYILFDITNEKISIEDKSSKKIYQLDKTIFASKEKIKLNKFAQFNSTVTNAKINLDHSINAEPIWWNSKIFTAQENGIVSCFDSTGKILWDYDTYGDIISTPIISDRIFAAATIQGDIVTLSAISGEQIQSIGFDENITTDLITIQFSGTKELMVPKLTQSKSAIIFGTASGKLLCYDLETLQEYWVNSNSKGMIRSKPISIGNKIFFTSSDGFIYCIDSRNGLLLWRWKEKEETDFYYSNILSDEKNVYAVSSDGTLYAVDLLLGKLTWKLDNLNALLSISMSRDKKYLFIKSSYGKIYYVTANAGKIYNEFNAGINFDNSNSEIIEQNGFLLFMNNGSVFTIDKKQKSEIIRLDDYSPALSLKKIGGTKLLISNYNGTILLFSLR